MSSAALLSQEDGRWLLDLARGTLDHLGEEGEQVPDEGELGLASIPGAVLRAVIRYEQDYPHRCTRGVLRRRVGGV